MACIPIWVFYPTDGGGKGKAISWEATRVSASGTRLFQEEGKKSIPNTIKRRFPPRNTGLIESGKGSIRFKASTGT